MEYKQINKNTGEDTTFSNRKISEFLMIHLDQFGDRQEDILKCLQYALDESKGGNILLGIENGEIIGAVVLNDTGMSGYIPENILVYIAVHQNFRGKGIGKKLMLEAINNTSGNIALHVEPDNPAFHLYKKLGFTNKYLEMRLIK